MIASINAANSAPTNVASSATSVVLLAANANCKGFKITNTSNQDMFIQLAATASIASYIIRLGKVPASGIPAVYEDKGYTGAI
jgi:hypothetical protein